MSGHQADHQALVTPFLLAPAGISNRKKQAGTAAPQLQLRRSVPPSLRTFSSASRRGRGAAGSYPQLKAV